MPKPIPLRTRLSIQRQYIIIDGPRGLMMNLLVKRRAAKTGDLGLIQRPIRRDTDSVNDLFRCCYGVFGRQSIQHPQLISRTEKSPCIAPRSVFL